MNKFFDDDDGDDIEWKTFIGALEHSLKQPFEKQ